VSAYQCATIPGGTSTECGARIETCAEVNANCGIIGNGCGGTIDCDAESGGCQSGELCGADPAHPQQCAAFAACQPLTAAVACAGTCGLVSNGCGPEVAGGIIDCEAASLGCSGGNTCGGAGVPNTCGQGGIQTCTPIAQNVACGSRECGFVANGCGAAYDCSGGSGCAGGSQCVDGQCEAVQGCTALTQQAACAGKECGIVGDNCGGTYTCNTCTSPEACGAITAFQCDIPPGQGCVARTQQVACAGKECGIAYDGCGTAPGNTFNCGNSGGACPGGQFCGAQHAYECDAPAPPPACTPNGATCASLGWACGVAVGNCGQLIDCSTEGRVCNSTQTCVGGVTSATTCASVLGDDEDACPLCNAVPACSSGVTRLTGRVIAPGQTDANSANQVRVPNAFVYILRSNDAASLPTISTGLPSSNGLSCDRCDEQDLGPLLVGAVSDANGNFTLEGNIPVGSQFLLVTKVGKFRRAQRMTLQPGAACTTTALPTTMSTVNETAGQGADDNPTRLPRSMTDGVGVNIPRMAVTTGRIDAMECVFYKMGLAQAEFGNFNVAPAHRIDLYRGVNGTEGAAIDGSTPGDVALYNDLTRLEAYDMVVSDCEGQSWDSNFAQRGNGDDNSQGGKVRQYVNRGGRMFLSHLSFSWLNGNGTTAYNSGTSLATGLSAAGTWDTAYTATGNLNTAGTGVVSIFGTRPRVSPRIQTFADWLVNENVTCSGSGPGCTAHPNYTFPITDPRSMNTSIAAGTEEFVYRSDANLRVQQFSFNTPFGAPAQAACGRVAYSGFHVAATGGSTNPFQNVTFPAHCTGDLTSQEKILLFMLFDLGTCVGQPPEPPECTKLSCGDECGVIPDGCGGTLDCGACPPIVSCVPTTCAAQGVACSTIADGCGGVIECDCNVCHPIDQTAACAGKCGYQSDGCSNVYFCGNCPNGCVPLTACPTGIECGTIGDGCDGTLNCGSCPNTELCGAHDPNVCDPPTCRPLSCYELPNVGCGVVGNGCGASINCGTCPSGQICTVVNGVPNQCAGCIPKSQPQACAGGLECGLVGNGCGGTVDCGTCPSGEFCGALQPNMCDPGPQCTPQACPSSAECGLMGDGCGGSVSCGTCPAGQLCGVYEAYKCGGCTPSTCQAAGAQCGKIGDGCGNELDCGECTSGTCGLGSPNKCGQLR
jgi:hypothetical protein